jgi:ubiquinone/menaquinone biosynthesis C-methylase UbiE
MKTQVIYRWGRGFRVRRMQRFVEAMLPGPETRILDVGGTVPNWELLPQLHSKVTLLNLVRPARGASLPTNICHVTGDGTALPFGDRAFDIVFSNSVIEHLGSAERQMRFASEVRRVGKGLWIQAPAQAFPVEPHLLAPFIHYLPRSWQRRLARYFTGWGWLTRPTQSQIGDMLSQLRLPTMAEYRALFPDCRIERERCLGLTKSLIAVKTAREE